MEPSGPKRLLFLLPLHEKSRTYKTRIVVPMAEADKAHDVARIPSEHTNSDQIVLERPQVGLPDPQGKAADEYNFFYSYRSNQNTKGLCHGKRHLVQDCQREPISCPSAFTQKPFVNFARTISGPPCNMRILKVFEVGAGPALCKSDSPPARGNSGQVSTLTAVTNCSPWIQIHGYVSNLPAYSPRVQQCFSSLGIKDLVSHTCANRHYANPPVLAKKR